MADEARQPKPRILVVEDEGIVARGIEVALVDFGYVPLGSTADGEDAIRRALETKPDLILMDIRIQGQLDGIEAASRIRSQLDVPIVYLTAFSDEASLLRAQATEPFGYVVKPFATRELRCVIEIALHKHRLEAQLKEREQWLSTTFRAIGDGIIATDSRNQVRYLNAAAERLSGWTRSEALGAPLHEIVRVVRGEEPNWLRVTLEVPAVFGPIEMSLQARDGTIAPVELCVAPIIEQRRQAGRVVVIRDVSERTRLQEARLRSEALEAAHRRVQEADRVKGEFLANLSHELRTPLQSMLGFAELLRDERAGAVSDQQREYLDDLLGCGHDLLRILDDVLDLSRLEAGAMPRCCAALDIAGLVEDVTRAQRGAALQKAIAIHVEVEPQLGTAQGDARMLAQVLHNLLSNAIKFTDEGGCVSVRASREGRDAFRLEVRDTGAGIHPEDLGRLFVRFQQLGKGEKRHPGTGLGLALTKNIVEALGGSVSVESTPGEGSAFSVVIPVAAPAAVAAAR